MANLNTQSARDESRSYLTPGWLTLFATMLVMTLIFVAFTPWTHQLDEIKNLYLMVLPPFLLGAVLLQKDFTKISWRTDSPTMFCGLWGVAMVCAYLLNPYKMTEERVVWFQMGCLTFTLVFAWLMNSEDKLRKTMIFISILGFISVLFGLFFFAGRGFTDEIYNWLRSDPAFRRNHKEWVTLFYTFKESRQMYSTILNEDFYGAFLVMTTAIPLALFFVEKERFFMRLFALCTFLLMNVCLVFTNSNDSYSATILILYPMFFGLGWAFVKREEWGLRRDIVITLLVGCAVLALTIAILQSPKIMQTWQFKSEAFEGRKILWSGGLLPWLQGTDPNNPHFSPITSLFGTGPGGYRFYFPIWRNPFWFDNQINNVTTFGHNWYFDILLEYGLFGLVSFFGLHIMVLVRGIRQIKTTQNSSHKFYQIAILSGLCAVALQNFFSPNNRWAVAGMIYWTMFGLSMGITMLDAKPWEDDGVVSKTKRDLATGIKIAALVLCAIYMGRSVPQGLNYWKAAKLNADGIRKMDYAQVCFEQNYEAQGTEALGDAYKLFSEAIRLNPTFATSYYKLGHVMSNLGETDKAIKCYETLNMVFPHYSELNMNLAILYYQRAMEDSNTATEQLDDMQKSWSFMREAARQSRKPGTQMYAAKIGGVTASLYEKMDMPKESLAAREQVKTYLKNFLDYEPKLIEMQEEKRKSYSDAQQRLYTACMDTSDTQGMVSILKQMYYESPDNRRLLDVLLRTYDESSESTDALAFFEEAILNAPVDFVLRTRYAEALDKVGKTTEAQEETRIATMLKAMDNAQNKTTTATATQIIRSNE